MTQVVSPDDEHDVLETCTQLKIKINTQKRIVRHVGHLPRVSAIKAEDGSVKCICVYMYVCMYVQLGVAIGFLLPTMMVRKHENMDNIAQDLSVMYYSVAGFTTVLLVLIILCKYNKVTTLTYYTQQTQSYHHCTS